MILCKNCSVIDSCFYCQVVGTRTECKTYKPMTNEEWLRSCTTEQLAGWIVNLSEICTIHHQCDLCDGWCDEKKVVEWLKQPHKE